METDAIAGRLRVLAGEYVRLVELMRQGQDADDEERRELSSERSLVHDELLRLTGRTREDTDMYAFARAILAGEPGPPPGTGSAHRHGR